jgi:hypothetical protein
VTDAERAAYLLAAATALDGLIVTAMEDVPGSLMVDASTLAENRDQPTHWQLDPDDNDPTIWHHAPSGTSAPLGAQLRSIAACYRRPADVDADEQP